jgi:hypothetical protein
MNFLHTGGAALLLFGMTAFAADQSNGAPMRRF